MENIDFLDPVGGPWNFSDFDKVQNEKNEKWKWGPPRGPPSSLAKESRPRPLPPPGAIFKPNPTATRKQMLPDARGATLWRVWGGGWQHLGVWGVHGYSSRALEPPRPPQIPSKRLQNEARSRPYISATFRSAALYYDLQSIHTPCTTILYCRTIVGSDAVIMHQ